MVIKNVPLQTIWEIRKEVMYPAFEIEQVKLDDDELGQHFGVYVNDKVVSIISVFLRNKELQFRKFATLKMEQGKGYGKKLLQFVFKIAEDNNCISIWCNARTTALGLYEKFEMKSFGEQWHQDGHEFVKMKIDLI